MADMEKICRTCMCSNQKLFPIFDEKHEEQQEANVNIAMMLTEFTKYKVDSLDDLPQSICSACKSAVQSSYAFKRKCEETYLKLLDILDARSQASPNNIKKEAMDYEEDEMEIPKALQNVSVSITENKYTISEHEETMSNIDDNENGPENDDMNKQRVRKDFLQVFLNENDKRITDSAEDLSKGIEDDAATYDNLKTTTLSIPASKQTRRKHKARLVELLKCEDCDKMFTKMGELKKHKINRHGEKSHICEFCQKGFRTIHRLKHHIVIHSKKRFICKGCSASYFTKEELDAHVKAEKHDKLKLCPECGLRCKTNDKLKVHMRRHTGEKPYKCKFCNKGFPRNDELRAHERCHTGEKTHFCNVCGKGFQKKCYLDKHSQVHGSEEKLNKCQKCKVEFGQVNDLKAHICNQITTGDHNSTSLLQNLASFW